MTEIDLDKLEQVARAVNDHSDAIGESSWYSADDDVMIFKPSPDLAMIAELSPQVVLELVRRLRAAEADAARYIWLRDSDMLGSPSADIAFAFERYTGNRLDGVIDAAIEAERAAQGASHELP